MAFERLGWRWYDLVLSKWDLPSWLHRGMLALAHSRAVQACRGGARGPLRRLARPLGMGGATSPLGWNMCYDPVVWLLGVAVEFACPTYVSDLATHSRAGTDLPRPAPPAYCRTCCWTPRLDAQMSVGDHCRTLPCSSGLAH